MAVLRGSCKRKTKWSCRRTRYARIEHRTAYAEPRSFLESGREDTLPALRSRHWVLKAALQKAFSVLPGGEKGNSLFQRYFTGSSELDYAGFEERLPQCRKHLENYFAARGNSEPGFAAFEVGTGSYPIIPIGLYLCGASKVITLDIRRFLSLDRIRKTLRFFCQSAAQRSLAGVLPWADKTRIQTLQSVAQRADLLTVHEILRTMGINPIIGDAGKVDLGSGSTDFIFSNITLQHIPRDVLPGIFAEFRRVAAPRAVMSHHIYMGDVLAHFDHSITEYNFLRFSGPLWRLIDNSLVHQNRLRLSDYRCIHTSSGWVIRAEDTTYGSTDDLQKVPLAREFQTYSRQDLLALRTWLVSSNS